MSAEGRRIHRGQLTGVGLSGPNWYFSSLLKHLHLMQLVDHGVEAAGCSRRFPARKLVWDQASRRPGLGRPAQCVEHHTQPLLVLWRLHIHQGQVWRSECSLFIRDVARIVASPAYDSGWLASS